MLDLEGNRLEYLATEISEFVIQPLSETVVHVHLCEIVLLCTFRIVRSVTTV